MKVSRFATIEAVLFFTKEALECKVENIEIIRTKDGYYLIER